MAVGPRYRTKLPDAQFWRDMIPCQAACPVHTDSGRYVQLIAQGELKEAFLTARSPNPLASVCGRVCAAPCEDQCRRGKIDSPVAIRALKRFVCERFGTESVAPKTRDALLGGASDAGSKWAWHLPELIKQSSHGSGRKVAIIGGGPAGLACAHDLAIMGYRPTIFEASSRPGGMMIHGIPSFRLGRELLEAEIQSILDLGVELKLDSPLGQDFGLAALRDSGHEAFFLSIGTQGGRDLPVEGATLDGVIKAIEFLININRGYRVELGRRVAVIGGGFVAFDAARAALRISTTQTQEANDASVITALDAARAALRSGVEHVQVISLESFDEMPVLRTAQGKEEFEEAKQEGIVFRPQRGARRFVGQDGRVAAIDLMGVKRTYDDDGRFNPVYDPDITESIEIDSVILAIGQKADLSFLKAEDGIRVTPQGTIEVDKVTLATSAPGVYAGGDVAFGPRNLIEAIANGKRAALSIDEYLKHCGTPIEMHMCFSQLSTRSFSNYPNYDVLHRSAPPSIPLDRRTGITEVELNYPESSAREQAERCLRCHIQTIYDSAKCVLCGRCVDVCPEGSLKLISADQIAAEGFDIESIKIEVELGSGDLASAMIKDDEKCIRCGLCATRCPTNAMTLEVLFYEDRMAEAQVTTVAD